MSQFKKYLQIIQEANISEYLQIIQEIKKINDKNLDTKRITDFFSIIEEEHYKNLSNERDKKDFLKYEECLFNFFIILEQLEKLQKQNIITKLIGFVNKNMPKEIYDNLITRNTNNMRITLSKWKIKIL